MANVEGVQKSMDAANDNVCGGIGHGKGTKTKTQIFLPPTTTTETYMIITVVPICSGNLKAIIS